MKTLVWLRNDLRLHDNPALFRACEAAAGVVAVYILCVEYIERHTVAPVRLDFIRRHLQVLLPQLAAINVPLIVECVEQAVEVPQLLLRIALDHSCERVHFNAEYPFDELNRDRIVAALLREHNFIVKRFHDRVIVPPGLIHNGQGEPYKVFTAFKRKWLQTVTPLHFQSQHSLSQHSLSQHCQPLPAPLKQISGSSISTSPTAIDHLFAAFALHDLRELWPAGEREAYRRLTTFVTDSLNDYKNQRDFPAVNGTSTLSPYLAVGAISPRQCVAAALQANRGEWDSGSAGASCWLGEIIWREFYQHVVVDYPQVCKRRAMQLHTEAFPWSRNPDIFSRWCNGQTGIPIVDAAMAQLNTTGWMHNRLRMVVAMFLTKNLQVDWRLGEIYFMSRLIDGDFAANNGGWQWSASTGTDAAPYFRIFNPVSQSQRFDPDGTFIRRYLPVLAHLPAKAIHQPPPTAGYPAPMVDLVSSRKNTIELFAQLRTL